MTTDDQYRVISREYPDGRRIIASVRVTDDADQQSDEAFLDRIEAEMNRRPPRGVDNPE